MELLNNSQAFALTLCILAFSLGTLLYTITKNKWYNFLFNPLVVALTIVLIFISLTGIDSKKFTANINIISFFLGPVVVMMGVSIFENLERIKNNLLPIVIGIGVGSLSGVLSVLLLSKALGIDEYIMKSLIAKSITAPMAIEVTNQLGADKGIVLLGVIIAGNLGAMFGPLIFKILGIKDPIVKGIALGTSSHAVGTSKAIELGETEGAMSSLSIALCGIATVIWIPIILMLIS